MTEREFYIYTVADELPRFQRLIAAIPETNTDWKPDPKSRTAKELASMMGGEAPTLKTLLSTGDLDFAKVEWPTFNTSVDIAAAIVTALEASKTEAEGMSEEAWDSPARMHQNGEHEWKGTRGKMTFSLLLDMVHHRGQLSTYIRAMGGKVPSIYGPSADSVE
jgi:hypothetical protein